MQIAFDHQPSTGSARIADQPYNMLNQAISDRRSRGGLTLEDCRGLVPAFDELVRVAAENEKVDCRALRVRTLLHLPRVASYRGWVSAAQIGRELRQSAQHLRRDVEAAESLVPYGAFALQDLVFTENFDPAKAAALFSSLHYLRSARAASENFALLDPVYNRPVTICSVSPLQWKRLGSQAQKQFNIPPERAWDVSRVYSCDGTPPNAVSFLLARVRNSLARSGRNNDLLLTAVDPNLGFTGASYRAANWQHWLTVQPRPYLYLDRRYASPRQLKERFGTSNLTELRAEFPSHHFEQSRARLLDSLIFCCRTGRAMRPEPANLQRRLHR